jgi:hypothetical protein
MTPRSMVPDLGDLSLPRVSAELKAQPFRHIAHPGTDLPELGIARRQA